VRNDDPGMGMITLADVLAGTGGALYGSSTAAGDVAFARVGIDSRGMGPGDLFVAVRGEVHDGHRFVPDAVARGATGVLVARGRAAEFADTGALLIEVDDTLTALGGLAAHWRAKFSPAIVGITGSIGKSSTKELAAGVLGTKLRVLRSPKSYNNEFGLPLSVLMIDDTTDVAVLEMGTFGPGELTSLTEIARPTVAVVTNVGHTHLERMGSQDGIARAKGELVAALPDDGVAVLNGDDPRVRAMAGLTKARTIFYGYGDDCDLRASDLEDHGLDGLSFSLHWDGAAQSARLHHAPLLGAHSVYTALAAAGTALAVGMSFAEVTAALLKPHPAVRLLVVPGPNGSTIIDDSYNAAPASVLAALDILARTPATRRLAVLGDMLELGDYEDEAHRIVGRRVAAVADVLLTIGPRARIIADEAARSGVTAERIATFDQKEDIIAALTSELRAGDAVLIKGSRGLALEDVVAALREAQ
jgi:UDP-N-acetylmuramoyl-tripeptide--D-alanyl-D-alanine ligase